MLSYEAIKMEVIMVTSHNVEFMLKKIGTKFQTLVYNRFYFMSQNRLKF